LEADTLKSGYRRGLSGEYTTGVGVETLRPEILCEL